MKIILDVTVLDALQCSHSSWDMHIHVTLHETIYALSGSEHIFWILDLEVEVHSIWVMCTRWPSRMQRKLLFLKLGGATNVFQSGSFFFFFLGMPKDCKLRAPTLILSWDPFLKKLFGVALTSGHMMPREWRTWISTSGKKRRLNRTQPLDDKRLKWNGWLSHHASSASKYETEIARYASQVHTIYTHDS